MAHAGERRPMSIFGSLVEIASIPVKVAGSVVDSIEDVLEELKED